MKVKFIPIILIALISFTMGCVQNNDRYEPQNIGDFKNIGDMGIENQAREMYAESFADGTLKDIFVTIYVNYPKELTDVDKNSNVTVMIVVETFGSNEAVESFFKQNENSSAIASASAVEVNNQTVYANVDNNFFWISDNRKITIVGRVFLNGREDIPPAEMVVPIVKEYLKTYPSNSKINIIGI